MKKSQILCALRATSALLALGLGMVSAQAQTPAQTQVFIRHGEKPPKGLGQLDCQGFNRAIALPARFKTMFGIPNAVFAPDPGDDKKDKGAKYSYVRPLATIEPLAIAFGLPVNANIGWSDTDALRKALQAPDLRDALVLIAWEHKQIEETVRATLKAYGADPAVVPKWQGDDFDSMYVVKISAADGKPQAVFSHQHQGLNGQSDKCPGMP